jgi:hypothetical protein
MIGNIFDVSIDYLLKEETGASEKEAERGYYASREVVAGYIISERKRAKLLAGGIFVIIASTIIPNVFFEYESIANTVMFCLMAVGVSLLVIFGLQLAFKADKYKPLESEPLVFDNNFLIEFQSNYRVIVKKYIGLIVFSFVLIFGGVAFANLVHGHWVDGVMLFLIATAVYIMIYAGYMLSIHNGIVNSNKREGKGRK